MLGRVFDLEGNGHPFTGFHSLKTVERVNGESEMTFTLEKTKANAKYFDDFDHMWRIQWLGQMYVAVLIEDKTDGYSYYREVQCIHEFYDDLRNMFKYESFTGSRTFFDIMTFIFEDTGYTFNIIDDFKAERFENFGEDFVLELFSTALERYGSEFEINGRVVNLKQTVGDNTSIQYRHKLNINAVKRQIDALDFATYGKLYGKDKKIVAEYTHPLADLYPLSNGRYREIPSRTDNRYTIQESLDALVKKEVEETLKISITFSLDEMIRNGYKRSKPIRGDRVLLVDGRIGLKVETRIVEVHNTYNANGEVIACEVTLSNFTDLYQQQKRFQKATKAISDALEGKKALPFEAMDNAVQAATIALQNAQTEITIPETGGFLAIDKNDPDNVVLFNSAGIGISTDGGQTFDTAMTGAGIVADAITTGTLNANLVRVFGGDDDTYIAMDGRVLEVHGYYDRRWFDVNETVDSRISIGEGFVKLTKLNDERGPRNLYLSNNGISTYWGGATPDTDEGFGSGVIEFWSHMYDTERRGLTLYSNLGTIGLRTSSRDIVLDANRDVSIRAQIGRVLLRPKDGNRSGDNEFSFNIKENSDKWLQDGWIQYGSESNNYASGLRFSKDPADPALYATNGAGDFFTGDFHAKDITAHGRFYGDVVGSLLASADNSYAMVDNEFRITDKNGYNNGNPSYMNLAAQDIRANSIRTNGGTNIYLGVSGTNDGEVRVTNQLLYNDGNPTYYPIKTSEVRIASSMDYKTNIEPLEDEGLYVINKLNFIKFHNQADIDNGLYNNQQVGVIAELSPEVAAPGGKSINHYKLLSYAGKAIQELTKRVEELEQSLEVS